ncbi:MAG: GntR family transcriptional regulator [Armatimonadota bacterium]|nr:GntR family transcriptional regulator [Armatimonadota bacterium]
MLFRIDSASGVPIYQQIVDQVKRSVAAGTLRPGDRLATVRELASDLVINPNTVARAYGDLERESVVETRRGLGTFVCETSSRLSAHERRLLVAQQLDRALVEALHLDISPDEVKSLLDERVALMFRPDMTLVKNR